MVLLTFTIGIINLCLGYALAVFLGYGPPSLVEGWDAIWGESVPEEGGLVGSDGPGGFLYPTQPTPPLPAPGPIRADSSPESGESPLSSREAIDALRSLNEEHVEASILKFNVAIAESGAAMTEIETRLRWPEEGEKAATVEACLAELVKDSESYLAEQGRLTEQFRQRMGELGDMAGIGEEVEMANLAATAQLETTISNLTRMDFHSDLSAARARLLEELGNLRAARHHLRDSQDVAFLAVARGHDRLGQLDPRIGRDLLTGLPNRIGLEIALEPWRRPGRSQGRQIGAILLDIDAFGKLNGKYGAAVGDRVLTGLTGVLRELCGPPHLLARCAGQRFTVVMPDAGPSALRKTAELLRQSIERTVLATDGEKFSVTVGGGVAALASGDTPEMLLAQAERALQHAKQSGANRTCFAAGSGGRRSGGIARPAGSASRNPALIGFPAAKVCPTHLPVRRDGLHGRHRAAGGLLLLRHGVWFHAGNWVALALPVHRASVFAGSECETLAKPVPPERESPSAFCTTPTPFVPFGCLPRRTKQRAPDRCRLCLARRDCRRPGDEHFAVSAGDADGGNAASGGGGGIVAAAAPASHQRFRRTLASRQCHPPASRQWRPRRRSGRQSPHSRQSTKPRP